jgi:glycosyltransferase involved in cell wall biosynthesis
MPADTATQTLAQVVPAIDSRFGGTSVSVPALCHALHGYDHRARLYFAGVENVDPAWPDYFAPCRDDWPPQLRRSSQLRTALQTHPCGVVHHHALWLPSLRYAHQAARKWNAPLVISPRGMLSSYALHRSRIKKCLARAIVHPGALEQAAGWHATSSQEEAEIRAAGFQQPVCVAPNGVDPPAWNDSADRPRWLQRFPELADRRILLFFARWHPKKGVDWLLDWWAARQANWPDWHLLIAGMPDTIDESQLHASTAKLGVGQRTTIADARRLPKPYRLAQLYVLPTHSENFGLTIAEALVSGVPVATTTDAPWQEINQHQAGACQPLDRLGSALEQLLAVDASELAAHGARGQQYVTANFSWDRQARALLDFYGGLT